MRWYSFGITFLLFLTEILAVPLVNKNTVGEVLIRQSRSPTLHKKHGLGGLLHGGGGNNYITNINNYAPPAPYEPPHHGHAPVGGSFAGSSAFAGGHGASSAQSQSASFAFGPITAAFSQSQAQSGGKSGTNIFDYFDY